MSSQIRWLPKAADDVRRLRHFIKSDNPIAAQRAAKKIMDGVKLIMSHPEAGTVVDGKKIIEI